jgi:hypothetical protein
VLSGRGLCDGLITRPEESYQLWCVVVCDLETSGLRRPWPTGGCRAKIKQTNPHRTTKGLGYVTIFDQESDLDAKSSNRLKSYLEYRSHTVRYFQIEVHKHEYQVMVNKGFILRALIVPSSNISLEFVLNVAMFFFTHYRIILRYSIEIDTAAFLFLLNHCVRRCIKKFPD